MTPARSRPGRSPRARSCRPRWACARRRCWTIGGALFDNGGDQGPALVPAPGNEPPRFSGTSSIERELGEITVTPQVASAQPFPTLGEGARLADAQINGVDQRNLTLGQSGDAAIVFGSEFASFVNALGVYRIDPNGQMVDPKIVFAQIEQTERDPNFPSVRPGGGPSPQAIRCCSVRFILRTTCTPDRSSACSSLPMASG
jgi:hypothetical protein